MVLCELSTNIYYEGIYLHRYSSLRLTNGLKRVEKIRSPPSVGHTSNSGLRGKIAHIHTMDLLQADYTPTPGLGFRI